jgi:hypothetical protein
MMLGNPEMQKSLGGYFGRRRDARENGLDGVHWMCVCVAQNKRPLVGAMKTVINLQILQEEEKFFTS